MEENIINNVEENVEESVKETVEATVEATGMGNVEVNKASDPEEARKTYSIFGGAYLGAAILNIIPAVIIYIIGMKLRPEFEDNVTFSFVVSIVTLYLIGLPFAYAIIKKIPKCEIGHRKMKVGEIISSLFIGYTVLLSANIVGTIINVFLGKLTGKGIMNPIANAITGLNPIVNILIVAILAPIIEELVFRKILVDRLYKYGEGLTILFSGLMFGLFHGNFAQFFYAFALGIYLAYIYMRTGKIRYTMYIHMFINTIGSLAAIALNGIDIELIQNYLYSGNTEEYMAYVMSHMGSFALLGLYGIVVVLVVITGIILAIVFHKKFHVDSIATELPKGTGLKSMFANIGMIAYMIFFVVAIVLAQFGTSLSGVIMDMFL